MIDSPTLDNLERPSGTYAGTRLVQWLQDALDLAHNLWPEGSTLLIGSLTLVRGTEFYQLPSDFVQDYEDGVILANDEGRVFRRSYSYLLGLKTGATSQGKPRVYTIVGGSATIRAMIAFRPVPDKTYSAQLVYYGLPATLQAGTIPAFPSDLVLSEYLRIRGMEWQRSMEPGSGDLYMAKKMTELKQAGLGNEAEPDTLKIDRLIFPGGGSELTDPTLWMGNPNL